MSLSVRKLTGRIGAIVEGVDLSGPASPGLVSELRELLNVHKALVFDNANLDDAGQAHVASWFGELTAAHPTVPGVDGSSQILAVDSTTSKSNVWHSDVTFVVNPPQVTTLRSITTTPYGGETLIANAAAAYRDLPEPLRILADSLWAVHSNDYDYAGTPARTEAQREHDRVFVSSVFQTEHPVVRVHPLTGERGLFIGGFVNRLVGLSQRESGDILRILQAYVTRPENVLQWSWSPNQLLVFDNRITQHYAVDNYDDLPRRLNRVTVAGDVPVAVDGRTSRSLQGDASHYSSIAEVAA